MKVVLQKDLYLRSEAVFCQAAKEYSIEFLLTDVLDEVAMLAHHKQGANCFVIGAEAYSKHFYETICEYSAVIRYGVGYNSVPIDLCMQRNIQVAYTPGTLTDSVAEHTFAMMLGLNRNIATLHTSMKNNQWNGLTGMELKGKTLAVLGFGQIGRSVAHIAKFGFNMRVHAFDVMPSVNSEYIDLYSNDYVTVVKDADIVSIHIAVMPETRQFINAERISQCKLGAQFINISRGELVDEKALFDALQSHYLSAAAIDVFVKEPYIPTEGADFRTLDNVLLSPHCGSNTREASNRMATLVIQNIISYDKGEKMILIPELNK